MKIAIYGQYKEEDQVYIKRLFAILQRHSTNIFVEKNYFEIIKDFVKMPMNTFSSHSDLDNSFDFMITVGGDGTMLRAVTFIRDLLIPTIGINTGRLGFLATISKNDIEVAIDLLFKKKYIIKNLTLLSVETQPPHKDLEDINFALNEVTVSRKNTASMITIKTYLDNEYLEAYWADGLIVATPTGSTGYSLSCGGPIITPQAKSLCLTPIAPHNLNVRPMIIPEDTIINYSVSGREDEFLLSLDSRIFTISNDTEVSIKKADFHLKMIQIQGQSFLRTLRGKLLWGKDTRN